MLRRKDKEKIVQNLTDSLEQAKSVVFSDYTGMSANEIKDLRRALKKNKVQYGVFKKTLIQLALDKIRIKANIRDYQGPVSLAISKDDEIAPAKIIDNAAKANENLKMIGGILENKYLGEEEIIALAKLPEKDQLIAKAIGSIKAPISNFVSVLTNTSRQLVLVLKAIQEKKA
ncbi:MAG: 50S ribosomal protein L10 [Patescibacteria group bacterium]|nr:50S ribosomal protein L10 [Patescibacteria group bacterium]